MGANRTRDERESALSLINQVLQNVEKRQGAHIGHAWSAQVKPVLSEPSVAATGHATRWMIGILILLLTLWLVYPGMMQWRAQAHALSVLDRFPPAAGVASQVAQPNQTAHPKRLPLPIVEGRLTKFLFSDWHVAKTSPSTSSTSQATNHAQSPTLTPMLTPTLTQTNHEAADVMVDADAAQVDIQVLATPAVKPTPKLATLDKNAVTKRIKPDQEVNVLIQRAVDAEQKGRVSEATALLRQALNSEPQSEDARLLLVNYLQDAKQDAEALSLLQGGVKAYPEQAGLRKALAKWQLAHGQAASAIDTLQPLANTAGQDMDWHWMLAMAHQQSGQHQAALPYFERTLQLQPAHAQAYVAYAVSLQALGLRAQALQQLRYAQDFPMSERMSEFVLQRSQQLSQATDR